MHFQSTITSYAYSDDFQNPTRQEPSLTRKGTDTNPAAQLTSGSRVYQSGVLSPIADEKTSTSNTRRKLARPHSRQINFTPTFSAIQKNYLY